MGGTALDFEGEIQFLKDLENRTGIFAPKPHISEIRSSEQKHLAELAEDDSDINGVCC